MTREEILQIAKPILFNTEMVRAILDGRKRATRRIAKIRTDAWCKAEGDTDHEFVRDDFCDRIYTGYICRKCGYGVSPPHSRYPVGTSWIRPKYNLGDYLYVRESFSPNYFDSAVANYRDGELQGNRNAYKADYYKEKIGHVVPEPKWIPSIHMPKEAARILLRVTNMRAERLQEIEKDGLIKEGIDPFGNNFGELEYATAEFAALWDSTIKNKDRDKYGWDANPWVWVIEFEKAMPE